MMFSANSGVPALLAGFDMLPEAMRQSLAKAAAQLNQALKNEVESNLNGAILQSKSGMLQSSIADEQADDEGGTSVSISIGDDVAYAAILEYGGQTKAHIIQATQVKTLSYMGGGKQAFLPYVNHPGSSIPEFAYMRSALAALESQITETLTEAVSQPMMAIA